MSVKGTIAKDKVIEKIKNVFGQDYIGLFDKKVYVWAEDEGEKVQIALTLTCPKIPVEVAENSLDYNTGIDFTNDNVISSPVQSTEISSEEKENVRNLMKRLGL